MQVQNITSSSRGRKALRNVPEYRAWRDAKSRCCNPKNQAYDRYGARGIVMCERWLHSFASFRADMGKRPGKGYSLDRIDNDGNYEPTNCCWATLSEQNNNKRTCRTVTFDGIVATVGEWSRVVGVPSRTIRRRVDTGQSAKDALTPRHIKQGGNFDAWWTQIRPAL